MDRLRKRAEASGPPPRTVRSAAPAKDPHTFVRRRIVTFMALYAAWFLAAGCGSGDEPDPDAPPSASEPAAEAAAPAPEPGEDAAVAPGDFVFAANPSGFPHDEHRGITCTTCHASPPGHGTHATVECTACHGTPVDYASLPVRSEADCLACHHAPTVGQACADCHGGGPDEPLRVEATLHLAESSPPVSRDLSFEHRVHRELACARCHGGGVRLTVDGDCAACHREHHRADAECSTCHPSPLVRHRASDHLGCGGAECHDAPELRPMPESRSFCLVCHTAQRDHEAPEPCGSCHVTGSGTLPTAFHPAGGEP